MSKSLEGNGKGNGDRTNGLLQRPRKQATQPSSEPSAVESEKNKVTVQMHNGVTLHGAPVHIGRHRITFEVFNPAAVPQLSEALDKSTIVLQGRTVYSGRAVISNVVDAGAKIVCEATLDETQWNDLNQILALQKEGQIAREFKAFLKDWQKYYTVLPEFKIVIANMQTFFTDLRLWLERMELAIEGLGRKDREKLEQKVIREIAQVVIPLINTLFENFEYVTKALDNGQKDAHARYMQQHLHPLILEAPFAQRTFGKPLGYPGDYEMVNMIVRNGYEGDSLFGKIVHNWFVRQPPAMAHRNRVKYLTERIELEAYRVARNGGIARIFNFACGPAVEVQNFFRSSFSEKVELTLTDFNTETLEHAAKMIDKTKSLFRLRTAVHFQKMSVYQLLKENYKSAKGKPQYDFVYCAGLFDYLPDVTCRQLMDVFYDLVAPSGLLVATNVEPSNPLRHGMEHLLDWHLIYRGEQDLRRLCPAQADMDYVTVRSDETGVNLFMEVRKPVHG